MAISPKGKLFLLQLCSSKELISFDCRSFHENHFKSFVRIIFEPILIQTSLLFAESWCYFPMRWNLPFKLDFCWGFRQNLEANFWKPPFAFTPKHANLFKDICSVIFHQFCLLFLGISDHLEMYNCILQNCKICSNISKVWDHLLFVPK